MSYIFAFLNNFIPFADPARPLWRDVLLSAVLCTVLYVAPQIDLRQRGRDVPRANSERLHNGVADETHQEPEQRRPHNTAHEGNEEGAGLGPEDANQLPINTGEGQRQDETTGAEWEPPVQLDEAGPANQNPHQPRPRDANREVGAKKAKAIARRNQQRAYNEFMREQGDAQRAEWARDENERQMQIAADQKRRAEIDAKVREKERQERERRKAREENERMADWEATKVAVKLIEERLAEKGFIGVVEVKKAVKRDEEWVRELMRREGIIGTKSVDGEKVVIMLTKSGWLLKLGAGMMSKVYAQAVAACGKDEGRASWQDVGRIAQNLIVSGG